MAFDLTTKEGKRKQRIAERAFLISERSDGDQLANWLRAEQELSGTDPEIWIARAVYRGMAKIGWGLMSPLNDNWSTRMHISRKISLYEFIAFELGRPVFAFKEDPATVGDLIDALVIRFGG